MKRLSVLPFGLVLLLLSVASSQAAAAKIPRLYCHKPVVPPTTNPTAAQVDAYNKSLPEYRRCIERYVAYRSAAARKYSELAQENAKAANAAIRQFNELVKEAEANSKK